MGKRQMLGVIHVSLMTHHRSRDCHNSVTSCVQYRVTRVFAGNTKYGYNVPSENVIGLRLAMQDGKYTNVYRKDWHFNWGPGKTVGIQNELVAKKGYGPALVLGDSDGDAWMLKDCGRRSEHVEISPVWKC
jgi:hypothetical protein